MATSAPLDNVELRNDPEDISEPSNHSNSISDASITGRRQDAEGEDASLLVIEHTEGLSNPGDSEDPHQYTSGTSSDPHRTQSFNPDKAKINARLISAACQGDLDAAKSAINDGADTGATGSISETALHKACRFSHNDLVVELLKHESTLQCLEVQDEDGWTPLISACHQKNQETESIVKHLLEKKSHFNIEARSKEGITALHAACEHSSAEVVILLLENNAQCDALDGDKNTPLNLASQFGDSKMVREILARNPKDVSIKNKSGTDALGSAILNYESRDKIIPLLLNRGLELDHQDAINMFSRGTSRKVSGSHMRQSTWLKYVRYMQESSNPEFDKPLWEAIVPILKFASEEEKVIAMLNADSKDHFDILSTFTEGMGLSKDICTLVWMSDRTDVQEILLDPQTTAWFEEMRSLKSGLSKMDPKFMPRSQLQWSAYYGEHSLVWYLLKDSQSMDKDNIRKALDIAKARNPKGRIKGKGISMRSNDNELDAPRSKVPDRDKKDNRFELTIDVLQNATTLVSLPNKPPSRPEPAEMRDMEALLQQQHATIVDFYVSGGQIDVLRSPVSVFDLIYAEGNGGINAIMKKAKSISNKMPFDEPSSANDQDEKLGLRWIHLPANNMDWMKHLTLRVYEEKDADESDLASFMDLVQRSQNELPTEKSPIKFMKPLCLREHDKTTTQGETRTSGGESQKNAAVGDERLALYTPYVTLGYCYSEAAKASIAKHTELISKYKERILHGPRSLNRFYYNALPKDQMNDRDMSQVVTRSLLKSTVGKLPLKDRETWPYITVDQLWLWVVDNETIITSSTHRDDEFDDLLINKVFTRSLGSKPPSSTTEMSYLLVSTCVDLINNLTWEDVDPANYDNFDKDAISKPILLWYAESLNEAAAHEKHLFEVLKERIELEAEKDKTRAEELTAKTEPKKKTQMGKLTAKTEPRKKTQMGKYTKTQSVDVVSKQGEGSRQDKHQNETADDLLEEISKTTTGHLREANFKATTDVEKDWKAIKDAATLLDEVKDIYDELVILRFLVTQQERVWEGLVGSDLARYDARSPIFTAYELEDMIKMTETIQNSIKDLLSLNLVDKSAEQSKALVVLAKKADDQSKENARQGKILYAFGFVTVVFTPLSFLSSLLAINTTVSQHDDGGELVYEPALMYGIIC